LLLESLPNWWPWWGWLGIRRNRLNLSEPSKNHHRGVMYRLRIPMYHFVSSGHRHAQARFGSLGVVPLTEIVHWNVGCAVRTDLRLMVRTAHPTISRING
jgi:hypothetical protein